MEAQEERLAKVKKIFLEFLEKNNYRKTSERLSILEAIYEHKQHFDVDSLYDLMMKKNFRVSRATIYNTIEVLMKCGLVRKHQFDNNNQAFYERNHFDKQHDHIICDDGEIIEFCDPRIQPIKNSIEELFNVEVTAHSLYFYAKKKNLKQD